MRILTFFSCVILCSTCLAADPGTQITASADLAKNKPSIELSREDRSTLAAQRESFIQAPELGARIKRLQSLEQQALQLAVDEPLKLGSIGTAILDIYPGSQTGHYALSQFYDHVDADDAKTRHQESLAKLQALMLLSGDGSQANAFPIMTVYDAHTYAKTNNSSPVGSRYQTNAPDNFSLLLIARPENAALQQWHFDLSHLLTAFEPHTHKDADGQEEDSNDRAKPWLLMQQLARDMDSAAQTAIGQYLASIRKFDDALSWLEVAARPGNVMANALMARIYLGKAEGAEDDRSREEFAQRALENHLHAIALGSTDSMYMLANLYINDYYGAENRAAAIPLFIQAADLGHTEAMLYLGHLYSSGREVEQNFSQANQYFARAAASNELQPMLSYARFLVGLEADQRERDTNYEALFSGLKDLSDEHPEAAVVLGNLYARGIGSHASPRRAVKWYKKAVKQAPQKADIVNEVVWTLTVSDIDDLKRSRYAKKIMDQLMQNNPDARARPEYLDTWAASHAARGEFAQAVSLQKEAIEVATTQQRDDVIDILRKHLQLFESGATITEKAP